MGGGGCLYIDCVGVFDSGAPHQPSGQGKKIIMQWSIFIPPGFVLVEGNPFTLCRKCLVMTSNCILESALHCLMWGVNHQGVWGVIRFGFIVHLVPLICWHIVIGGSWQSLVGVGCSRNWRRRSRSRCLKPWRRWKKVSCSSSLHPFIKNSRAQKLTPFAWMNPLQLSPN